MNEQTGYTTPVGKTLNAEAGRLRMSVLIPVYNWDVSALLDRICRELDTAALWDCVEVIVVDDASSDLAAASACTEFCAGHQRPRLTLSRLDRNLGRSAVRNLLAAKAGGEFLLFLDCDVLPDDERFLRSYFEQARQGDYDVVCGGVSYRTRVLDDPAYDYHAYLGNRKEVKPARERNSAPWRHVLTSNIMVRKSVFLDTPFDERFTGYGYEDIEWGVRLAQRFRILHIDNTVSHLGLVSKERAYEKMRDSVSNYLLFKRLCPHAFGASTISKVVSVLSRCSVTVLDALDRRLGRLFLASRNNRLSFVLFQINFAVLLARALKAAAQR